MAALTEGAPSDSSESAPIIVFDGVCNLCHDSVRFVLKRDPARQFRFAHLQSDHGRALLRRHGVPEDGLQSVILIRNGRAYTRSTAALRIARELSGGWPLLSLLLVIPRPVRDAVYDFVGDRRYRWFGKMETCRVPDPDVSDRFLG